MDKAANTPLGTLVQFSRDETEVAILLHSGETLAGLVVGLDEHLNLLVRLVSPGSETALLGTTPAAQPADSASRPNHPVRARPTLLVYASSIVTVHPVNKVVVRYSPGVSPASARGLGCQVGLLPAQSN